MKKCSRCKQIKHSSNFQICRKAKDGLQGHCKPCQSKDAIEYRRRYPERTNKHSRRMRRNIKKEVMEAYGGTFCNCCGEDRFEFLTIDHVKNDGGKHRKEIGRHPHVLYYWLKRNKYPPDFQVLCMNCNWAKGIYGICPHKI